jgi:hypothetical protein
MANGRSARRGLSWSSDVLQQHLLDRAQSFHSQHSTECYFSLNSIDAMHFFVSATAAAGARSICALRSLIIIIKQARWHTKS